MYIMENSSRFSMFPWKSVLRRAFVEATRLSTIFSMFSAPRRFRSAFCTLALRTISFNMVSGFDPLIGFVDTPELLYTATPVRVMELCESLVGSVNDSLRCRRKQVH